MKINVLVTGANGQLGQTIKTIAFQYSNLYFLFTNSQTLDVTNSDNVDDFFSSHNIDWCINCAAYTNVEQAEMNQELANDINVLGVKNIATACLNHHVKLIHISTDFVFDGNQSIPYKETDAPNPQSIYGKTKLKGELEIKTLLQSYFIIRTSWLYSEFGHNFLKTMLRLASEKDRLTIVNNQAGTPTYAKDLAHVILKIIQQNSTVFGTYHYSNKGQTNWFDFANAIFEICEISIKTIPVHDSSYPTLAKRPCFSVLDKTKIENTFNLKIPHWEESLKAAISKID